MAAPFLEPCARGPAKKQGMERVTGSERLAGGCPLGRHAQGQQALELDNMAGTKTINPRQPQPRKCIAAKLMGVSD